MFTVLEDHEDTFVFENNLDQVNEVGMRKLSTQRHLTDSGLRQASVLDVVAFLLWFELLYGVELFSSRWTSSISFGISFNCFVDSTICSTADEANNMVLLVDLGLGRVAVARLSAIDPSPEAIECNVTSFLILLGHREARNEARHVDGSNLAGKSSPVDELSGNTGFADGVLGVASRID